jgi:AcrR family transcriptional regulator
VRARSEPRDVAADILDGADRLLARYGYSKMTVDDIARAAGIGKGSVYLHFPSKEAVVLALVDRMVRDVFERLRAIAADTHRPAHDRLRRMLAARVLERIFRFRRFSLSLHDLLAALRPTLVAQREAHLQEEARIIEAVIREGIARREFRRVPTKAAAMALLVATNSLLPYYLSVRELGASAKVEQRIANVTDLLLAGLAVGHAPGRRNRP